MLVELDVALEPKSKDAQQVLDSSLSHQEKSLANSSKDMVLFDHSSSLVISSADPLSDVHRVDPLLIVDVPPVVLRRWQWMINLAIVVWKWIFFHMRTFGQRGFRPSLLLQGII